MTKSRHDIDIHFQSNRSDWETPDDLFNRLNDIFQFDLDVGANQTNHKCDRWLGPGSPITEDVFSMDGYMTWLRSQTCWMNPPYDRKATPLWIKEAYRQWLDNNVSTVCLVAARTETRWFQLCWKAPAILFIKGRLKFGGAKNSAPFPSCLVFFTSRSDTETLIDKQAKLADLGTLVWLNNSI